MKKNNTKIIVSVLFLFILGLTACSSKQGTIEGKYLSIYNDGNYLMFEKDGSFQNNWWTTTNNSTTKIDDSFVYTIDENNLITVIDTTEYEGQDSLDKYEIGIIYKDYICVKWNGRLSKDYTNTSITNTLGEDLILTYNLKTDKTYEFIVTSNDEVVDTEYGTYSINGNEITCTSNEGQITTFIDIDENTYCIEYVKE